MRALRRFVVVLVVALGFAWAGSVPAQAVVAVSIEPVAKLVTNGAVRAVVVAMCDPGHEVLEAHLSVSQDAQAIFGQAGIAVRCDGKSRKYRVTVTPAEGNFHAGDAFGSAFVLTCADPTCGTTEQGEDARTITVRREPGRAPDADGETEALIRADCSGPPRGAEYRRGYIRPPPDHSLDLEHSRRETSIAGAFAE